MVKKIPKQVVKKKEAETQGATRKKKKNVYRTSGAKTNYNNRYKKCTLSKSFVKNQKFDRIEPTI